MIKAELEKIGFSREDWLSGEISQHGVATSIFYFIFGSGWTIVALVFLGPVFERDFHPSGLDWGSAGGWLFAVLIFVLLGPLPMVAGLRNSINFFRWGRSTFKIRDLPRVGGQLRGEIYIPNSLSGIHKANVILSNRKVAGLGLLQNGVATRGYFDRIIWSERQVFAVVSDHQSMKIPVTFTLPPGLKGSDSSADEPTSGQFWKIEVRIKRTCLDYSAQFTIPVSQ